MSNGVPEEAWGLFDELVGIVEGDREGGILSTISDATLADLTTMVFDDDAMDALIPRTPEGVPLSSVRPDQMGDILRRQAGVRLMIMAIQERNITLLKRLIDEGDSPYEDHLRPALFFYGTYEGVEEDPTDVN